MCLRAEPSGRAAPREATSSSDGVPAELAGPDADHLFHRLDPDLAVADLAGAGRLGDDVDDALDVLVLAQQLDAGLRDEVDLVLRPAVHLRVARLAAEALDLGDGHAVHLGVLEGVLHLL